MAEIFLQKGKGNFKRPEQREQEKIAVRNISNTIVEGNRALRSGDNQGAVTLYNQALEGMKTQKISSNETRRTAIEHYVKGTRDTARSAVQPRKRR